MPPPTIAGVAATYGVFCADCNEVFGTYESRADAESRNEAERKVLARRATMKGV